MPAGKWDFTIEQGAKFTRTITVKGRDLTGYTGRMQIRPSHDSDTLHLELTTENGRMSIAPGVDSVITLSVDASDTKDLSFGNAKHDLELIPSSGEANVERLLQGDVELDKEVTKPQES